MPPIDPNMPEQPHPLESMIESTIMQNEEIKANGDETNSLLQALIAQNEGDNDSLIEAQIFQDKQIGDEIVKAVKEAPQTINFEMQGVEMATLQGEQGEMGPPGKTPEKGVDYFTPEDIQEVAKNTAKYVEKGADGKMGPQGPIGPVGPQGPEGVPGKAFLGINGKNGADGKDGEIGPMGPAGKDGSPDTPKQIKKKLESLKDDERLDYKAIKGIETFQKQIDRVAGFASQGQEYRIAGTKVANNAGVLNFVAGSGATITGVPTSDGADITITASGGGGGGGTTWLVKTANYTATSGEGVLCDSSGGAFTITLPASPSAGDTVIVKSGASAATNNITIGRNSQTIVGVAENMTISQPNIEVNFVYSGSTWSI